MSRRSHTLLGPVRLTSFERVLDRTDHGCTRVTRVCLGNEYMERSASRRCSQRRERTFVTTSAASVRMVLEERGSAQCQLLLRLKVVLDREKVELVGHCKFTGVP